ncbi:secreted RxLR effector protein 161-like [Gossypium hirsutum]|uniref:Secreted RxLR effector protein 161-like n=1 Tax=Gossypium hirsutum TaxID=3635 RepID=A0ABM2YVH5_GOSHI|nr:secreted RxLR effector protein 161-like [Gossypium hirsutum]
MFCPRLDVCFAVGLISRYQANPSLRHWQAVKHISRYLKSTRDYMLMYFRENLTLIGYIDSNFQTSKYLRKPTLGNVFVLGRGAVIWRIVKQTCTTDSTMEVEYMTASEVTKEEIWLRKFLTELEVIPGREKAITLYCDNNTSIANTKKMRSHLRMKDIDQKYHLL